MNTSPLIAGFAGPFPNLADDSIEDRLAGIEERLGEIERQQMVDRKRQSRPRRSRRLCPVTIH